MKIGLLECDHVIPELRTIGGDYRDMFPALLPDFEFVNYDVVNGHFPESTGDCDVFLCTGSKYSVYEELAWIDSLKDFIRALYDEKRKFVGVCFGHQLLAEALGGKVEKGSVGWCVGVHHFEIVKRENWMEPFQTKVSLVMSCQDQVIQVPDESVILARSADCEVGMFRVGERMLAIQAHPEFPRAYASALIERRVERIGEDKARKGIESLGTTIHDRVLAGWIRRFIVQS